MKKLSKEEVLHIAKLANLTLTDGEAELLTAQLSETLAYVSELQKIPTDQISPTFQTTGLLNVFREDEVKPSLTQKEALANSKETYHSYFKVKAVLEPLNP